MAIDRDLKHDVFANVNAILHNNDPNLPAYTLYGPQNPRPNSNGPAIKLPSPKPAGVITDEQYVLERDTKILPADRLDLLKPYLGENKGKTSEALPSSLKMLKDFEVDPKDPSKKKFGRPVGLANNVEFLKRFSAHPTGQMPDPGYYQSPIPLDTMKTKSDMSTMPYTSAIPTLRTDFDNRQVCRCSCGKICTHTAICCARCHYALPTGHYHTHSSKYPVYSPYAHLYYMGRPLTTTEYELLHDYPVRSR